MTDLVQTLCANTYTTQGHDKRWRVTSSCMLSEDRQLKITTAKSDKGHVYTSASVSKVKDNCETFVMFQDYLETVAVHNEIKRVTQSVLLMAHNTNNFLDIVKRAKAFYNL